MSNVQENILNKLLLRSSSRIRIVFAWISLWMGIFLLLLSVNAWNNYRQILYGPAPENRLGKNFVTIQKKIQPSKQSGIKEFSADEIADLMRQPLIKDLGALMSATFPALISIDESIGFSTLVPLESAPARFVELDINNWHWEPGQFQVPMVMSADLLKQYNFVFAPSQGLPILSEQAIKSLNFKLEIGAEGETYLARIVGFSDQTGAILVPEAFLNYGNAQFGAGVNNAPVRLLLEVVDPSDPEFIKLINDKDYEADAAQLKWNKLRVLIQFMSGSLGLIAIALTGISILVFLLFVELVLTRSKNNITLLLQLGYSPKSIRRFIKKRFYPILWSTLGVAMFMVIVLQIGFRTVMQNSGMEIHCLPGWPVWILALAVLTISSYLTRRSILKNLK